MCEVTIHGIKHTCTSANVEILNIFKILKNLNFYLDLDACRGTASTSIRVLWNLNLNTIVG